MAIKDTLKDFPVKTTVGTLMAVAISVVTAALYVDDRYAHAEDVGNLKTEQRAAFDAQQRAMTVQTLQLKKTIYETQAFQISAKPIKQQTDVDRALLREYERQISELSTSINQQSVSH